MIVEKGLGKLNSIPEYLLLPPTRQDLTQGLYSGGG